MQYAGKPVGKGRRVAVIVSRFNALITERLLAGAQACLARHGVAADDIDVIHVPGAWELPIAARFVACRGGYAAVIALGCVIRGETPHFEYVAGAAATGLGRVAADSGLPIAFGVLTTEDTEQALARAGGKLGNKGWDAAETALEMADLRVQLENGNAGA